MECADVPDVSNEERNDYLSSTVVSETPWQCKPEFSTDNMVGDNKNLTARCRWSRTVSVPAECRINVGCVGSLCGSLAVCRNKATSTVVVLRTTPVSLIFVQFFIFFGFLMFFIFFRRKSFFFSFSCISCKYFFAGVSIRV